MPSSLIVILVRAKTKKKLDDVDREKEEKLVNNDMDQDYLSF